ncbi:hypothetical protein R69919_03066 [Paraburkholderia gardini]|jgi:hypothetical protein|uniref:Uncharacterized protein n=1 Tax=Paraburkholderia gardini TaxID=2823469 RepID=A0ABM8U4L1_9BURK|nr:hypothetical protein R54767_02844 [Paraburkholderia gardini]CAG4903501.1 hypothetical protein R69919_03066 [Paraburkholderia gardini]
MPSSFGIWSTTMTIAIPALNPVSTGPEMKFARKPSRNTDASTRITPTINVSVAVAIISSAGLPSGAARPSAAATRMASVVVVLTPSGRDVPVNA